MRRTRLPLSRSLSVLFVCALSISTLCGLVRQAPPAGIATRAQALTHSAARKALSTAGKSAHVVQYYGSQKRSSGFTRTPYRHAMLYTPAAGDYVAQTDGVSRWPDGHTIRVYVAPAKPTFPGIVASCFSQWSQACGGRIKFVLVDSPAASDYQVSWTSRQREGAEGTEAGLTTTDTYIDEEDGQEYIDHARTRILTRFDGRMLSDKEIAETVLHEIGHGLGIEGHSSNCCDIMYYAVSSRQTGHLTTRDCNTIARLYAR